VPSYQLTGLVPLWELYAIYEVGDSANSAPNNLKWSTQPSRSQESELNESFTSGLRSTYLSHWSKQLELGCQIHCSEWIFRVEPHRQHSNCDYFLYEFQNWLFNKGMRQALCVRMLYTIHGIHIPPTITMLESSVRAGPT